MVTDTNWSALEEEGFFIMPETTRSFGRKNREYKKKACLGIGSVDSQICIRLQNKSEIQDIAISLSSGMATDTNVCIGCVEALEEEGFFIMAERFTNSKYA
ncbi:hypothetical protein CEXT_650471 [Caerostris extrusa]|uniref:Transposase n=1 Tax=Caerostris extrusa TaxID=172846 RepID=A0AAV4MZM4_CAEEX|nr:hypothetical protein CEXT_650471 [Caerostris extrusa]